MADGILNPIEQLEADFDFDVYTKQEVDALLDEKADKSDTYTKTETDALLNDKADADAVYTKTETDTLLSAKADKSTTYTKTETDNLLNGKADADNVYTKTEINTKIPNTVGSATKPTYVNGGVLTECTYELNKTVPANAVFTDTTYSAGNGLNLSGTSFSAKAGVNVSVDGNGINVNGNGAVASADSGLLSGGTAYTELRPTLDGTWVKNAQTTATNLQKLEGGIEYLYGLLSHQYDQLKKYINGNYYDYDTDTDSKYTKTVLAGAMPYASLDSIGGKTLVWNQLFQITNLPPTQYTKYGLTCVKNINDNTISVTGTVTDVTGDKGLYIGEKIGIVSGHKYLILCSGNNKYYTAFYGVQSIFSIPPAIVTATKTGQETSYLRAVAIDDIVDGLVVDETIQTMFIDLTLMYGAGNEPSTVEEFTAQFPASYYSHNAGTLLSAGVTEVVSKKADTTTIATYSIPAEVQAIEGYGWSAGSVYNYIDYERKVFVQNVARVDMGTLTWTKITTSAITVGYDFKGVVPNKSTSRNYVTPKYEISTVDGFSSVVTKYGVGVDKLSYVIGSNDSIYIIDSSYADEVAFKSGMSGVYLYYELDTPIEVDISQYLTDDNLIEVEAGGSLTFPNSNGTDYQIPVPSAETYMVDLQSALGE